MTDSEKALDFMRSSHSMGELVSRAPVFVMNGQISGDFDYFYTPFKGLHDLLITAGGKFVSPDLEGDLKFPVILIVGAKQKAENAFFLASALKMASEDGVVMVSLENDRGGKSLDKLFEELGCPFQSFSKHKSRIVWTTRPQMANPQKVEDYIKSGSICQRSDGTYTRPGIFSWDRLDKGTKSFIENVAPDWRGTGADFGGGCGDLAKSILEKTPELNKLYVLEHDVRAVDCARANLRQFDGRAQVEWVNILKDDLPRNLDFIVMNPPFHEAKLESITLGQSFIRRAALSLKRAGRLTLVANVHLPYEKIMSEDFNQIEQIAAQSGFKIVTGLKK
ncbi:MAG: methyltransferase [Alphaproteobacteria bacterium]|nr:methyltransferase [Alphaproteobacteria bacterium]